MQTENFSKEVAIKITLGHLLLAWEVLSQKLSDLRSTGALSEEEMRAIWGLADLMENALIDNEIAARPQAEWDRLISEAREFMKTIPVDFLE